MCEAVRWSVRPYKGMDRVRFGKLLRMHGPRAGAIKASEELRGGLRRPLPAEGDEGRNPIGWPLHERLQPNQKLHLTDLAAATPSRAAEGVAAGLPKGECAVVPTRKDSGAPRIVDGRRAVRAKSPNTGRPPTICNMVGYALA